MTEQEKRMEAAGWRKCYWLGIGNLQTEYDYEPSEELVADMEEFGDYPFQLDEEAITFLVTESSDWKEECCKFINNPELFCESWLESLMRFGPIEPDFLKRAIPAMAEGFRQCVESEKRREKIYEEAQQLYEERN